MSSSTSSSEKDIASTAAPRARPDKELRTFGEGLAGAQQHTQSPNCTKVIPILTQQREGNEFVQFKPLNHTPQRCNNHIQNNFA